MIIAEDRMDKMDLKRRNDYYEDRMDKMDLKRRNDYC